MTIFIHLLPSNPALRRQDNDLWSGDNKREHEAQNPIPASQICPQELLRGIGVRAFGHVGEVEPGDWYRVDERGQNPGQELDCRELEISDQDCLP